MHFAILPPTCLLELAVLQIAMPSARRFPPPWSVEETDACFIVRDHNGQALAYVYCEDESGRRAAAHLLTRDEARRIAANTSRETPETASGLLWSGAGHPKGGPATAEM